jgi:uncharacterized protein YbjT (DUF2867 family)
MRCLVIGATGYVGGRLVTRLVAAGHEVRCLVRNAERAAELNRLDHVQAVLGDALNPDSVREATAGTDVVFHLVHSLSRGDFADADRAAAENVMLAADGQARRIVYLGGLRPPGEDPLSAHLASRAEVGDVFLAGPVPAVVLQASVIIGSGSTSFEMLRFLAERLPVLPGLKGLDNATQPVAIADVLHYLLAAADPAVLPDDFNRTIDIGGPEVISYRDFIGRYARIVGQPTPIWVPSPPLPSALSALAISGLTPISAAVAEPLLVSLAHPMVCAMGEPQGYLPEPPGGRLDVEESIRRAVVGVVAAPAWQTAGTNGRANGRPLSGPARHDPALLGPARHDPARHDPARHDPAPHDPAPHEPALPDPAQPAPHDPKGSGGPEFVEERRLATSAGPAELWRVIESIGGDNGWYTLPGVWQLRGALDRAVGGVGDYRGRRDPVALRRGEVLDWWRVEEVEQGKRLLLRAEMRMPGTAWLEMSIGQSVDGRSEYRQRVIFRPSGPAGHLYWWGQRVGHEVVFGVMAKRLVRAAERLAA